MATLSQLYLEDPFFAERTEHMESRKLYIPNISCHHCIMTIQRELKDLDGVSKVDGDPGKKEVTVEWTSPATLDSILALLEEINYPPAD